MRRERRHAEAGLAPRVLAGSVQLRCERVRQPRAAQDLGFAGLRVHYPIKTASYQDEVAVFLGASYFRMIGRDQVYGLSARGIAIDTALASGEEFPWFREFWLVQPRRGSAGAHAVRAARHPERSRWLPRLVSAPGAQSRLDVEMRLFARKRSAASSGSPRSRACSCAERAAARERSTTIAPRCTTPTVCSIAAAAASGCGDRSRIRRSSAVTVLRGEPAWVRAPAARPRLRPLSGPMAAPISDRPGSGRPVGSSWSRPRRATIRAQLVAYRSRVGPATATRRSRSRTRCSGTATIAGWPPGGRAVATRQDGGTRSRRAAADGGLRGRGPPSPAGGAPSWKASSRWFPAAVTGIAAAGRAARAAGDPESGDGRLAPGLPGEAARRRSGGAARIPASRGRRRHRDLVLPSRALTWRPSARATENVRPAARASSRRRRPAESRRSIGRSSTGEMRRSASRPICPRSASRPRRSGAWAGWRWSALSGGTRGAPRWSTRWTRSLACCWKPILFQARLSRHPVPDAFLRWRLGARAAGRVPHAGMPEPAALAPTPPLVRGTMTSERFSGRRLGEWRRRGPASAEPADPTREERRRARVAWGWRGRWRRALLAILVVVPSVAGRSRLSRHAAGPGLAARRDRPRDLLRRPLRLDLDRFLDALFGFVVLLRGGDRFAITRDEKLPPPPLASASRTAMVMPVCDEPVERVFAGLRARASRSRSRVRPTPSISSSSPTASIPTSARTKRRPGRIGAATARGEAASSTGAGGSDRSGRAATSRTSAGDSAVATATWSCSTPTA